MAPDEQTEVPMVMWFSGDFIRNYGVNVEQLRSIAGKEKVTHDNLYHTVMGLLKVKGSSYEKAYDLNAARQEH